MKTNLITILVVFIIFCLSQFFLAAHPLLMLDFELLWTICSLGFLLIWVVMHRQDGKKVLTNRWTQLCAWLRTHRWITIKKIQKDPIVPVEQLKLVRTHVQRLGLALHGLTPDMETARRMHFQLHGEKVPSLVLPPQHATLYAEFESMIKLLNHFGFPSLESVRLQQKDIAFIQQWGSDLEMRLRQLQQRSCVQQEGLRLALATVAQQHKTLGGTCPSAQDHAGYQRIQGALRFLEKMVNDNRCQCDFAQTYVQKLQADMNALMKQFERVIL